MGNEEKRRAGRPRLTDRARQVALRIAEARKLAGKSAEQCANALGIAKTQYQYLERQCSPEFEAAYLHRLAELFDVSVDWLGAGSAGGAPVPPQRAFAILSPEEQHWFGERARLRREELSLSRVEIAERIGPDVSAISIMSWERSLPRRRRPVEAVWEQALRVPEGWLRNSHLKPFPPTPYPVASFSADATASDEIRRICCWLVRKNPYCRTIDSGELNDSEWRMVDIMLHRYGLAGEEEATLQRIGDRIGLTRERVRQIADDFMSNIDGESLPAPIFDQVKRAVQAHLPCKVDDLDIAIRDRLGESLSIAGVERFAREVLGRSVVRIMTKPGNLQLQTTLMAVKDDPVEQLDVRAIRQIALSMVRLNGAAQSHFAAGMASATLKRGVTPDDVVRSCRIFSNFEWLNEEEGWFWFGPVSDNRAKTAALKVLSLANRNVDVEEIHNAMARARLTRYDSDRSRPARFDAPIPILQELLGRIPGIQRIQYNDFRLDPPISPDEVLSASELKVVEVIRRHGGMAARHVIFKEVLEVLDVTPVALNFVLDNSPIMVRLDRAIWAIRGAPLNPAALAEAIEHNAAHAAGRSADEFPPSVDGWRSLIVTVPDSAFKRGHWLVPVFVQRLLESGDYSVDGHTVPVRYLTNSNPGLAGLTEMLSAIGIGPNEEFQLDIHAAERRLRFNRLDQVDEASVAELGGCADIS